MALASHGLFSLMAAVDPFSEHMAIWQVTTQTELWLCLQEDEEDTELIFTMGILSKYIPSYTLVPPLIN